MTRPWTDSWLWLWATYISHLTAELAFFLFIFKKCYYGSSNFSRRYNACTAKRTRINELRWILMPVYSTARRPWAINSLSQADRVPRLMLSESSDATSHSWIYLPHIVTVLTLTANPCDIYHGPDTVLSTSHMLTHVSPMRLVLFLRSFPFSRCVWQLKHREVKWPV